MVAKPPSALAHEPPDLSNSEALIQSNRKAEALEQHARDLARLVETVRQKTLEKSNERIETLEKKARDLASFVETTRQQILSQSDKKIEALEQKARDLADFVETLRHQTRLQSEKEIEALGKKAKDLAHFVESVRQETRLQFKTEIAAMGQKARDLAASVEALREITLLQSDSEIATLGQSNEKMVAMNEALLIAGLRQHEFAEVAEKLNVRLRREIADREKTEEALCDSRDRLEFTLESARLGDWDLDLVTDTSRRSSRHDRIFGYSEPIAEWGYSKFLDHVHPDDRVEVNRKFGAAVAEGREWHFDCRVIWPDATVHWIEAHGNVYRNAEGMPRNMLGIVSEITARKTAEESSRLALEEIARVSRAKDDFLAALSHELRTPLTPVLLAAATMREDERLPADVRKQLAMMERNITLEARLIDDLLDVTKISHGKFPLHTQPCNAHSLISLAVEIVSEDARLKEILIECNLTARCSGLTVDPARFQQVIWNLLRNAVKFTPRGGKISIATREEKKSDGTTWLRIAVTDSGIGITPALLEHIFLPFNQGSLPDVLCFGGVGLGLAIARAVVNLHGGRITAQSGGANCGATFVVELPGAVVPPPDTTGVVSLPPVSVLKTKTPRPVTSLRLLVVEDHENTRQALSRVLEHDGHRVVPAATVAEALTAAAANKFDLVISDLGLPDGSGAGLMEKLRAGYGLLGVALSGYGMDEDVVRSRKAGFVTHLVKPVSITEIRRVVASLAPLQEQALENRGLENMNAAL